MKILNENKYLINRKKILYEQRYAISRLAKDIELSFTTVDKAIKAESKYLKAYQMIAKKLGVSLVTFWPELFGDQISESAENIVHHDVGDLSQRF